MKILNKEIALREETRNEEQAKPQLDEEKYAADAEGLGMTQEDLLGRTELAINSIRELPEGEGKFSKEIQQLTMAARGMTDAMNVLREPDTGSRAIAAETDAIEWLLLAKRSKGGGGGGSAPGNGSRTGKNLNSSALALLGESDEDQAKTIDREIKHATGKTGEEWPEEFRFGLDKYFEVLEKN